MMRQYQWHVFGLLCLATAVALVPRFVVLFPLYTDNELRTKASALIQATVVREGWLSSGLSVKHISDDGAKLLYRSHLRGSDPIRCFHLSFTDGSLSSCTHKR